MEKQLEEIYNNQLFNYILTTKGITKEIFEQEKKMILKYYNILKSYDMQSNIGLIEVLLYLYLNKNLDILEDNIKVNNSFKINSNNYQTEIGNIVLIDEKKVGIFLGTFPNDLEIKRNFSDEKKEIEINFKDNIPYFYSFEDNKIISGMDIWWNSFPQQVKIKNYLNKIFTKENIELIINKD